MNNLKNISGELLAIAYLDKEDRNVALEDLNTIIGAYSDNDLPQEQKALLQEIINDLIKENTPSEGFVAKTVSKPKVIKKSLEQIEVVEPEIVQQKPEKTQEQLIQEVATQQIIEIAQQKQIEITQPELSIEDVDDAF